MADGLKEMDFGVFEGRNYREMEHDPQYRAWVENRLRRPLPGRGKQGGILPACLHSICRAGGCRFGGGGAAAGDRCPRRHPDGGLERFAVPHKNYYSWCAPAAGGFVLDAADWIHQKTLRVVKTVQYTKGVTMLICWAVLGGFVLDANFLATRLGCRTPLC